MADYATLLRDHVTLTCRSVDRIFLQAYIPKLQCVGGVCQFVYWQKGFRIPSSAAFGKIGDAYVAEVHRWAKANGVAVRRFAKGENKEQIARPLIVRLPGRHRYQLTPLGRRVAVLFTKVYGRVLAPGLAELDPRLPTDLTHRSDLAHAWRLDLIVNTALTKRS